MKNRFAKLRQLWVLVLLLLIQVLLLLLLYFKHIINGGEC